MTLPRGFGQGMKEGTRRSYGVRTFWLPPSTEQRTSETTVVLLDDAPVCLYRHQLFIKGDKDAAQMRQTCADPQAQDDVPRSCMVCEAMIRHKNIGRKLFVYLTVIDERAYKGNDGRDYKDQKLLLELDKKGGEIFAKRKEAHGSLTGMRFRVYRSSSQNSARYGDLWEKLGNDNVDLVTHFWYSPAIPRIMESSSRGGSRPLSHEQAVAQLVTPYNYDEIMESYKPAEAERFVIYLTGGQGGSGGGQGGGQQQGGYQAPPPPPARGGAPQSQPNYAPAVPAGQVPTHAQPQYAPPPQQQQPQGQPGYAPPPPPRTPDPAGAPAPQGQYQAPPAPPPRAPAGHPAQGQPAPQGYPPVQGQTAPTGTFTGQYQQQPQQGGYPGAPPQAGPGPQPAYTPPPPPVPGQGAPQGAPGYAPPPPPQQQQRQGPPPQANQHHFERGGPGWSNAPPGLAPPPQGGPPQGGPPQGGPPPQGEPDLPF